MQQNLQKKGIDLPYDQCEKVFDSVFESILLGLKEGYEVFIPETFGRFILDFRKSKPLPEAFLSKALGKNKVLRKMTRPYITAKFFLARRLVSELTETPLLKGKFGSFDVDEVLKEV